MKTLSEMLDQQTRGESIAPNPGNRVTKKRKHVRKSILEKAGGNNEAAYKMAMGVIEDYLPRLQEFVLEHGEEPAPEINDLVKQVYEIRMHDVNDATEVLDYDNEEALTWLDQQEDQFENDFGYKQDSFLGELFAPIEIAYTYLKNHRGNPDGLDLGGVLGGVGNMITGKLNKSELIRAAQGKPAGVVGTLATGGVSHYNALRAYFRAHPDVAKNVLNGSLTDESQLPGWQITQPTNAGGGFGDPIRNAANDLAGDVIGTQFKKALPYIIGFVVLMAVIVYFAARSKK